MISDIDIWKLFYFKVKLEAKCMKKYVVVIHFWSQMFLLTREKKSIPIANEQECSFTL